MLRRYLQMRFDLINQLLYEHSMLSTKKIKLGFFEMQDYAKIMDDEQRCSLPMKMLSQWCRQMQSKKKNFISKKQKSQIQSRCSNQDFPSHFQKQFQEKLRNRSQQQNSVLTECQKRKYLLQIIK